jgi:hypothetical protein
LAEGDEGVSGDDDEDSSSFGVRLVLDPVEEDIKVIFCNAIIAQRQLTVTQFCSGLILCSNFDNRNKW